MINVSRQAPFLDIALLARSRVLLIGVGRAITAAQMLASTGLGAIALIDPDVVEAGNVGLSGYGWPDVGRPKVEAARDMLREINPDLAVTALQGRAEALPRTDDEIAAVDLVKIGIDDPAAQFALADRCQALGTPALIAGTTGDNRQHFVALVYPGGPPLRAIIPAAWDGVQRGYRPPRFFHSARIFAERLNLVTVECALGVLHHLGKSPLRFAEIGAALIEKPLLVGLNGMHEDLFSPCQFIAVDPHSGIPAG